MMTSENQEEEADSTGLPQLLHRSSVRNPAPYYKRVLVLWHCKSGCRVHSVSFETVAAHGCEQ